MLCQDSAGSGSTDCFELVATSLPCRTIGGDFFDYFELSRGAFGVALGDVAGKGPPAALLAAMLQGIFAAHACPSGLLKARSGRGRSRWLAPASWSLPASLVMGSTLARLASHRNQERPREGGIDVDRIHC